MIKDFEKVELPKVDLGNLTIENCHHYYVDPNPDNYPYAWFGRKFGKSTTCIYLPGKPEDCPGDFKIRQQFDSPMEALLAYADMLQKEHADLSDRKMKERSPFFGRGRNCRWEDEAMRRGLR